MKIQRYAGAIMLAGILVAAWACNNDKGSTTSPSPPTSVAPIATAPPPLPPLPAPAPPTAPDRTEGTSAKARYSGHVIGAAGTFGVTIEHLGGWTDERVGVACYENPDRTTGANQTWTDDRVVSINSKGTVTVGVSIPQCVPWQCDAFEGTAIRVKAGDVYYGRRLILGRSGGPQGSCSSTPECEDPPCNPPVCNVDLLASEAAAQCDQGNFILDVDECTFECKPPVCDVEVLNSTAQKTAAAKCEHGVESITLDSEECTFDFTCKPPPQCNEHDLRVKAEAAAAIACEHGVDEIFLDLDECTFDFTCLPPPTCEAEPNKSRLIEAAKKECGGRDNIESIDFVSCTWECEIPEPECVEIGTAGPFAQQGNPANECAFFGDFVPTRGEADFYICKAGTEIFTSADPFGATCPNGKDKSHETKCVCDAGLD